MNPCVRKKGLDCLYPFTVKRCRKLSKNNPQSSFRIEIISIFLLVGCHLDQRTKNPLIPDLLCNQFLAVYAIHQAHNCCMLPNDRLNAFQRFRKRSILQGHDQQIHILRLLRTPNLRTINFIIDPTAAFFQPVSPFSLCNHTQTYVLFVGQSPDYIRAHSSCT